MHLHCLFTEWIYRITQQEPGFMDFDFLLGQLTQEEMEIRFIDSFSRAATLNPGKVSYVEFEEYYEGLSIVISSDNDFSNVMRNCWGV